MGYYYDYEISSSSSLNGLAIWMIISAVVAVMGGLTVYFIFLRKDGKYTGILNWLHDFLNFKKLLIEDILKISYLIVAAFLTLSSFGFIAINFVTFLVMLIGGNLGLRIIYETSILLIKICQNTSEINNKLKK